jgi:hypothetical protein
MFSAKRAENPKPPAQHCFAMWVRFYRGASPVGIVGRNVCALINKLSSGVHLARLRKCTRLVRIFTKFLREVYLVYLRAARSFIAVAWFTCRKGDNKGQKNEVDAQGRGPHEALSSSMDIEHIMLCSEGLRATDDRWKPIKRYSD